MTLLARLRSAAAMNSSRVIKKSVAFGRVGQAQACPPSVSSQKRWARRKRAFATLQTRVVLPPRALRCQLPPAAPQQRLDIAALRLRQVDQHGWIIAVVIGEVKNLR